MQTSGFAITMRRPQYAAWLHYSGCGYSVVSTQSGKSGMAEGLRRFYALKTNPSSAIKFRLHPSKDLLFRIHTYKTTFPTIISRFPFLVIPPPISPTIFSLF